MSDARELREIKLREQVEHALRRLEQAPPEHREAARQALEEALDAFNQFRLGGRSEDQHDD